MKASLASFDLTLGQYVNAIPTRISSSARHFVFDVPDRPGDAQLAMLHALGLTTLDLGYDLKLHWDEASQTLALDKAAVEGKDLGSVSVAMLLGNAVRDLFGNDMTAAAAAGQAMTIKSLNLDLVNDGFLKLIYAATAKEQNATPEAVQAMLGGTGKGMVLALFGANPQSEDLATAVESFLEGAAKALSAEFTAKAPEGIPLSTLESAQDDPSAIANAIDIRANAQ